MWWIIVIVVRACAWIRLAAKLRKATAGRLPSQFVVFDLETTGLNAEHDEIIEIGAIRVNRNSGIHDTFQCLVKPGIKVPKQITELTGISQWMIDADGRLPNNALADFSAFVGDLPLVAFSASFDTAFLNKAADQHGQSFNNKVSCALKMARRAWPDRNSYRLADLARDSHLCAEGTHRALGDCKRTLTIYKSAAARLGSAD